MKRSTRSPDTYRLSALHTLEVPPIGGNVWLEISHGLTISTTAFWPAEARIIAKALVHAADQAGGKPPKKVRRTKP